MRDVVYIVWSLDLSGDSWTHWRQQGEVEVYPRRERVPLRWAILSGLRGALVDVVVVHTVSLAPRLHLHFSCSTRKKGSLGVPAYRNLYCDQLCYPVFARRWAYIIHSVLVLSSNMGSALALVITSSTEAIYLKTAEASSTSNLL